MKRISILSALLLMCAMTFAQQALWGGAPVVSPEIHDNNTVTFRLKAPKAVKVQVTGDFLPTQKIKTFFLSIASLISGEVMFKNWTVLLIMVSFLF